MNRTIVNVVGLPGAGKSATCKEMVKEHNYEVYRPSDRIREFASMRGARLGGRADFIAAHECMIAEDDLAMVRPLEDMTSRLICIDGLRAPETMEYLRERYGAISVYLECPFDVRFQRSLKDSNRTGHRRLITREDFWADEQPDLVNPNRKLPNMIEMQQTADYVIDSSVLASIDVCRQIHDIVLARGV